MLCNVTYEWHGEQSFKRKYLLPVKTPFELAWDYSILGAGSNLLKITVTNKIEKRIAFEECALNSQVLNISTVYESPKTMLGFNDTFTKVRKNFKNIFLIFRHCSLQRLTGANFKMFK